MDGTGTEDDPWRLTTPPGSSSHMMYRDESEAAPLVCQMGTVELERLPRNNCVRALPA